MDQGRLCPHPIENEWQSLTNRDSIRCELYFLRIYAIAIEYIQYIVLSPYIILCFQIINVN